MRRIRRLRGPNEIQSRIAAEAGDAALRDRIGSALDDGAGFDAVAAYAGCEEREPIVPQPLGIHPDILTAVVKTNARIGGVRDASAGLTPRFEPLLSGDFPFPLAESDGEPMMVSRPCGCTSMVVVGQPVQVSWCDPHDPGYPEPSTATAADQHGEPQCDVDWGSATASQRCVRPVGHGGIHIDGEGREWGWAPNPNGMW